MKKHYLSILICVLPVMLMLLIGGCITITIPQTPGSSSDTPSNPPSNVEQLPTTPEQTGSAPIVNSFTAYPASITYGASSILSWDISGASTASINQGIGNVASSGSMSVSPLANTTYTLTAGNTFGTTVNTTRIIVTEASPPPTHISLPVINLFIADSRGIVAGESTILSWNVSNANAVTISPTIGTVAGSGSIPISPSVTTNYILTATNAAGARTSEVTVTVSPAFQSQQNLGWTGTWDTNWGTMELVQDTGQVTGTYAYDTGKIKGSISKNLTGNILSGTWSEEPSYAPPDDAGDIEFTMSADRMSFTGKWRYDSSGEWRDWHGTRVSP